MENKINTGIENISQTEQNSVDQQPAQTPEKPKINYWMISAVVLFIVLLAGGNWFLLNSKKKISSQQPPTSEQANQAVVMGVIRTAGLSDKEKKKFGLIDVNYQITNFGNYQKNYKENQIRGYFLLSNNAGDDLLGKCVRVTGIIPEGWRNKSKAGIYNRSVINVAKVEKVDNSNCNPYGQAQPTIDNTQEKLTLRGSVSHAKRPSPDIGYDYQLKLSEPFVDKFSPAGLPSKVGLINAIPATNNLWIELENNINKDITVEGYMVWGYAESRYFQIIAIKRASTFEQIEVKNLVTKFEKYIQDRNVEGLMSLYTPAKTKEEIASYRNLMGQDPDVGSPRLFHNVTTNFIVTNWKIARRQYPDNKELIIKDGNKYFITVEETRKSWCNADPCAGTYSFENTNPYIFEIVKSNSRWLVNKYYFMNENKDRNGGLKYEGLGF